VRANGICVARVFISRCAAVRTDDDMVRERLLTFSRRRGVLVRLALRLRVVSIHYRVRTGITGDVGGRSILFCRVGIMSSTSNIWTRMDGGDDVRGGDGVWL